MHVGLVLPQVSASWDFAKDWAHHAEEVGCDSVWVVDHVLGFPPERGILEAWTMMSAVGAITERVEVGAQVLCQSFRNPALLAKMAATLDDVTSGRLRMLVGAGWHEPEYRAFGWDFPSPGDRIEGLRDTVRILKGLLSPHPDGFTYEGTHYSVRDCVNVPLERTIPIEVGGGGDRLLRLVAEEADGFNSPGALLPRIDDRLDHLRKACEDAGRSIDDLRLTCQIVCATGDDEAAEHPGLAMFSPSEGLIGSVEQTVQRAGELQELGFTGFHVIVPPGSRGKACLERLVGEVRPQLS